MQYTKLGNADLTVSRVCMGCMGFGDAKNGQHSWTVDEAHSREIIRRGLELGVNFFDTAIGYQSGTSEQYLGRALRDFAKRDNVVVATKFLPRTPEEIAARRNLAYNPYDEHGDTGFYPHASANVETRGEAVFAARNAIDGIFENSAHGEYPYQSWGINRDPNAALTLDFGREVLLDELRITERADFPHDNYWVKATVEFSDGSTLDIPLVKSAKPQSVAFEPKRVRSLVLKDLIQAEGTSPFPALTQIEAFGTEVK